jgi:predicted nucleotidyltransferase
VSVTYETYRDYLSVLVERLRVALGEGGLLACCVFGSVARGEARPDSDLDLLIVHRDGCENPLGTFLGVLNAAESSDVCQELVAAGYRPDPYPVFLSERDLWERPLILLDPMDHGITLWDTGVLARRFAALRRRLEELGAQKVVLPEGGWYWDLKPDWKPGEVITL